MNNIILRSLAGSIAALASAPSLAEDIPNRFRGVWQLIEQEGQTCRASDWNSNRQTDTHLKVEADKVRYHENECRFRAITKPKPPFDSGAIHIVMTCEGEGERWTSTEIWQVLPAGNEKTLVMASTSKQHPRIGRYQNCTAQDNSSSKTTLKRAANQSIDLRQTLGVGQHCFSQNDNGASLDLTIAPNGSATFSIDVVNPRTKHLCHASGKADKSARGWRYVDGSCRMDVEVSDRIRFRFDDDGCERRYCGARASITSLEISDDDRRISCPPQQD